MSHRTFLIWALIAPIYTPTWAANFWLSGINDAAVGSLPPTTVGAIPTLKHGLSATQGTFYIWARPTATQTLENWSLKVVSSDPNIVTFDTATVHNPQLGMSGAIPVPVKRWEFVDEPTGALITQSGLEGLNIFGVATMGVGIGPASDGVPLTDPYDDPLYNPAKDAWLLASINYSLHGMLGQADIHLQIGPIGMNHAEAPSCMPGQTTGCESHLTNVVFGLTSDPPLNAKNDRFLLVEGQRVEDPPGSGYYKGVSSATPEMVIEVTNMPSADFDDDNDIDGRDFLTWQRGHGISSGAQPQQGDANFDGAVNGADLAILQAQYGQPPPLSVLSAVVPEPSLGGMLFVFAIISGTLRGPLVFSLVPASYRNNKLL